MGTRRRNNLTKRKTKKKKTRKKKTRKKLFLRKKNKKQFHISGRDLKRNTSKMSYDIFGKREIIDIMQYRAIQALDNLTKLQQLKKHHYLYEPIVKEYKRRLVILLHKKKNRYIYKKVLGESYAPKRLDKMSHKKLEKIYYILLHK
jgi:hypothetical protein